jgi:hypothetical protein
MLWFLFFDGSYAASRLGVIAFGLGVIASLRKLSQLSAAWTLGYLSWRIFCPFNFAAKRHNSLLTPF